MGQSEPPSEGRAELVENPGAETPLHVVPIYEVRPPCPDTEMEVHVGYPQCPVHEPG